MSDYTIYHNPRCSKSRQALALLQEAGKEVDIILYLEDIPSTDEIKSVLKKLGLTAADIVRKGEPAYKEHFTDVSDEDALIALLRQYPKVIERPIIIKGDVAVIARPPETLQALLS